MIRVGEAAAVQSGPAGDLQIDAGGERLTLLPEKAVWWARTATLLVADVHIGKAASFRAQGVPVPRGTTSATLARLDGLLRRFPVGRIVFLGDLLHSRRGRVPATMAAVACWRAAHGDLELVLVRGNHDARAGDPPEALGIRTVPEPWNEGTLTLRHAPEPHASGYVLAGHVHPAVVLRGRGRERVRLPCYWFGGAVAVLPAFGAFTGTCEISPQPGDRVYVIAEDRVLAVPAAGLG